MIKKIILIITLLFISSCAKASTYIDTSEINRFDDVSKEFDFPIHSYGYMLVDLADFDILYAENNDVRIYPASLTKVMTLDTVLHLADDLNDHSSVTYQQVEDLIREDASLAYIERDYPYTLRDLLYALNLPSGADAAVALENYFNSKGIDLVEQMNILAESLGCQDTHFVNTTGLHDNDHYTSINDLYKIVMDTLSFEEGRRILTTLDCYLSDGTRVTSGIRNVYNYRTKVLGGKTGYTDEAGQNIIILYRYRGKPYVLITVNAMGSLAEKKFWHFDDALDIFEHLY